MPERELRTQPFRLRHKTMTAATALLLAACGTNGGEARNNAAPATIPPTPAATGLILRATFTFDSLLSPEVGTSKGGSNTISVYSSPKEAIIADTYSHGETAQAVCAEPTGRLLTSDTTVGAPARETDDWVGIAYAGDDTVQHYATLLYGALPPGAFDRLPPCNPQLYPPSK